MKYDPNLSNPQQGIRRLATLLLALCLPIAVATILSGSFFKLGTLQPDEIIAAPAAHAAAIVAPALTETGTVTGTTTGTVTGTTTAGVTTTGTTTPEVTTTGTAGTGTTTTTTTPQTTTTGTTTPQTTVTGTAGTGTVTPEVTTTGTGTPGATGTAQGTGTPGATTTGTPGAGCTPRADVAIAITDGSFVPSTITVDPGTRVTWTNIGNRRHRVRDINHVLFDSGDLSTGQQFSYTFCVPGTYLYEDSRDNFTGTIIVTGNPPPTGTGTTTPGATTTGTTTPGATGTGTTTTITPQATTTGTGTPGATGTAQGTGTPGATGTGTPQSTGTAPSTTTATVGTGTPQVTRTVEPSETAGVTQTAQTTATAGSTQTAGVTQTAQTTATAGATQTACSISFTDVSTGSTFYPFVQCLACRHILGGYPDGTYRPSAEVTRGQLSKIVSNSAGFDDTPNGQTFEDVAPDSTFYVFIERMAGRNIIGGYPCGGPGEPCGPDNKPYFRPGNNATRGQIAKIVSIAAGLNTVPNGQTFEDVAPGSTFYLWIEQLAANGSIGGYPCGGPGEPCGPNNKPYFRPSVNTSRGQIAKIVSVTFFPECPR